MRNIIKETHIFYFVFLLSLCLLIQTETTVAQSANELIARAKVSIEKKEYASAVTDLTAAIKLDANSSDAFLQRAFVFSLQNNFQSSLQDVNESIRLDPQNQIAYGMRGIVYFSLKDFDKAIADYTKGIQLYPKYQTGYYNRALAYGQKPMPDWKAAEADFTAVLDLAPEWGEAYAQRAFARLQLDAWGRAERDYLAAAKFGVSNATTLSNLSYAQIKLNYFVEATLNARAALELAPNDENAKKHLAYALAQRQKPSNETINYAFVRAVNDKDTKTAIEELNRGAEVDFRFTYYSTAQKTALIRAAGDGNLYLVKALVSVGANVNAVDDNQDSALGYSTDFLTGKPDKIEILKFLMKTGANVNHAQRSGETILHRVATQFTITNNHAIEATQILLKAGAKVEIKDSFGVTPLMRASRGGTAQVMKLLLAAGADPNAVNNNNHTPLIYAVNEDGYGLVGAYLLLKAGARAADLPSDKRTEGNEAAMVAVKQMAAFAKDSLETKLFDAAVNGNSAELASLLPANSSIDKTLLNYLLMISVVQDNPAMLQALIAKGADPNYKMGNSSAVSLAQYENRKTGAYLANYATAAPTTNSTAQNERKIAELINDAAALMNAAADSMTQAQNARAAGKEKSIWCLRVNDAANEINLSLKSIKEAEAVFSLQYQAKIKEIKDLALRNQRIAANMGCPISFKSY